ncbi:hypothetical protein ACN57_03025 [Escherichia coli]|nr:hypothetical protein ACN57_03025 [Escherichia coli]
MVWHTCRTNTCCTRRSYGLYKRKEIASCRADCYRLRWQIELAFKRLKSLLHLDALRAKEPELAKAWIFANLLFRGSNPPPRNS